MIQTSPTLSPGSLPGFLILMILFYDFETTGKLLDKQPLNHPNQPRVVSAAAIGFSEDGKIEVAQHYAIVRPDDFIIPEDVVRVHGISHEFAMANGIDGADVLYGFLKLFREARIAIAFNNAFDNRMAQIEILRRLPAYGNLLDLKKSRCAMMAASAIMKLPNQYGYEGYAWPKLHAAYEWMFKEKLEGQHHAMHDTRGTAHFSLACRDLGYWDMDADRVLV